VWSGIRAQNNLAADKEWKKDERGTKARGEGETK